MGKVSPSLALHKTSKVVVDPDTGRGRRQCLYKRLVVTRNRVSNSEWKEKRIKDWLLPEIE